MPRQTETRVVLRWLAVFALSIACISASCNRAHQPSDAPKAGVQVATTLPATSAPSAEDFTHTIISETALIRRGKTDADVIYDSVAPGTRVRAVASTTEAFVRVVTDDGREGLVPAERLAAIPRPGSGPANAAAAVGDYTLTKAQFHPMPRPAKIVEPTKPEIDAAIEQARAYLLSHQTDGIWDEPPKGGAPMWLPKTSMAVVALGETWQSVQSSEMKRAIEAILQSRPADTFTASLRVQILGWPSLGRANLKVQQADDLIAAAVDRKPKDYGWFGSTVDSRDDKSFNPVGSYWGQVGIRAREEAGAQLPDDFWKSVNVAWQQHQTVSGSYSGPRNFDRVSVFQNTTAALLAMYGAAERMPFGAQSLGNYHSPGIDRALNYIAEIAPEVLQDLWSAKARNTCETAWWLNEVLDTCGERNLGHQKFADEIARFLIASQETDGSWGHDILQTSWAIRCLNGYAAPVAVGKLRYLPGSNGAAWNERPRDAANLARFVGYAACETRLNWQVADLDDTFDRDFTAPILLIAGHRELEFGDQELSKLRRYVERGGLILGNADAASSRFGKSFEKLGNALFPQYEFRSLPNGHPVFSEQFRAVKWARQPELRSMSNGVRELIVLIPSSDIALSWHRSNPRKSAEAFQLGANIYMYATGRQLPYRRDVEGLPDLPPGQMPDLRLASVDIGANSNPEPNAWPRMKSMMWRMHHIAIDIENVGLAPASLAGFNIAHMTGTANFALTPPQRDELKRFVNGGGILLVDAAGGSKAFADAAEAELKLIFANDAGQLRVTVPDAQFMALLKDGKGEDKIRYRTFARMQFDSGPHASRLRAISRNNRLAVIFSREDLVAGMAGVQSDGIVGYDVDTATALVSGILHSANPK